MEELQAIVRWVERAGLPSVLIGIIVAGVKAWWVPGFAYTQMRTERDAAIASLDKFVGIHEAQTRILEDQARTILELKADIVRICDRLDRRGRT